MSGLALWIKRRGPWQRVGIFLLLLGLVWLPPAALVYWLGGWLLGTGAAEIGALVLLYGLFLWMLPSWGRRVRGWSRPFQRCGLRLQPQFWRDMGLALIIGALGVFALFGIETLLGWARISTPSPRLVRFVFEGALMALAVGFAEEMLFRGWVLAELEEGYSSVQALVMNALFFAGTHFVKPWSEILRTLPQFVGLAVLGVVLVWARRSPTGPSTRNSIGSLGQRLTRLGYPIGLHAGLIWGYYIVNVGGLSEYTGRVPEWVTGIDSNPLAGLMGVLLLGFIGWPFAKSAQSKTM